MSSAEAPPQEPAIPRLESKEPRERRPRERETLTVSLTPLLRFIVTIVILGVTSDENDTLRLFIGMFLAEPLFLVLGAKSLFFPGLWLLFTTIWSSLGTHWYLEHCDQGITALCTFTGFQLIGYLWDPLFQLAAILVFGGVMTVFACFALCCDGCVDIVSRCRRRWQVKHIMRRLASHSVLGVSPGEDLEDCTICGEEMQVGHTVRTMPCKHSFHKDCIDPWITRHNTCPNCRSNVDQNV
jgi:hypothetical protein